MKTDMERFRSLWPTNHPTLARRSTFTMIAEAFYSTGLPIPCARDSQWAAALIKEALDLLWFDRPASPAGDGR